MRVSDERLNELCSRPWKVEDLALDLRDARKELAAARAACKAVADLWSTAEVISMNAATLAAFTLCRAVTEGGAPCPNP